MSKTITLHLDNLRDGGAPLYYTYPGQTGPQPAHILMNEDGDVRADWDGEIGGAVPMPVWHRRTLRWAVDPGVDPAELIAYLEGDGQHRLQRVLDGHSLVWDGNNHVGRLTEDARDASERIERDLEVLGTLEVWTAADWLFPSGNALEDAWGAQPLADAVRACHEQATRDGVVIDGGEVEIEDALLHMAERRFADADPETDDRHLTDAHLAGLVDDGRITQERADGYRAERDAALAESEES